MRAVDTIHVVSALLLSTSTAVPAEPGHGYASGWVDAHGGCRSAMPDLDRNYQVQVFLDKPSEDWTKEDLKDYALTYAQCIYQRWTGYRGATPYDQIPEHLLEEGVKQAKWLFTHSVGPAIARKETHDATEKNARRFAEDQNRARIAEAERQQRAQEAAADKEAQDDADVAARVKREAEIAAARHAAMIDRARKHKEAEEKLAAEIARQAEAEEAALAEAKSITERAIAARRAAEVRLAKVRADAAALKTVQEAASASLEKEAPAGETAPIPDNGSIRVETNSEPGPALAKAGTMTLDDFRLDYDKLRGRTVTLVGTLMMQGEMLVLMPGLYKGVMNTDFIFLDWDHLAREKRKLLMDRCRDLGCSATVRGRATDVMLNKGMRVEAVSLD